MMKCQECEKFLEEYLDGELAARESAAVEAHLAACAICADARDALLSEANVYASYERGVEVTPRMWGGVEARIRAEQTGGEVGLLQRVSAWFAPLLTAPRFSPALTAALVLVAIGLTVGVMKLTGSREQPPSEIAKTGTHDQLQVPPTATQTPQPAATSSPAAVDTPPAAPSVTPDQRTQPENRKTPVNEQRKRANELLNGGGRVEQAVNVTPTPGRDGKTTPEQLVREAEQRYIAAIQMLERDVKRRRTNLDPQTAARFDETLAAIDRSIGETRKTVRQHGSDPVAVQYMLSAYAKKVEVLREMAHVEQ